MMSHNKFNIIWIPSIVMKIVFAAAVFFLSRDNRHAPKSANRLERSTVCAAWRIYAALCYCHLYIHFTMSI